MNVFIFFVLLLSSVECYKILVSFPLPVRSLGILGEGFVKNLINAGHEVTYITVFPLKKHNYGNKLRQIDVSDNIKSLPDNTINIGAIMNSGMPTNDLSVLQEFVINNAILTFENENVKKLLESTEERFDVVIADLYESEIYSVFSLVYDCPMIWSYSMGVHWQVLRLIDEPTNAAYTADYLSSNVLLPFTFQQRVEELWAQIKWNFMKRFSSLPAEEEAYEKHISPVMAKRGKKLPNYEELMYNVSLLFCNEHHATGNLPSTPQNLKFVGGQHIETPVKPLPEELQTLMDNSKHGVIYFSMGSTWKSKDIPKAVTQGLLKIFGELRETVIWKYEEELPNLPQNVHILKWAPQPSILAHPNCLFFISHGGLLSSTEAIHFGVPIIGIPIYFDQFVNVNRAVVKGYAISVPLSFNLPNDLKAAIRTMLSEPRYRKKVTELSKIYHDRPVTPGVELVHWVEHVVRTRGALHLRSPALHIPFYQKYYLDLAALIIVSVYVLIQGVRQGCVASPWLFNLFMNNCLADLKEHECGLKLGELLVKCLLYADDQVLVASSAKDLHNMVTLMVDSLGKRALGHHVDVDVAEHRPPLVIASVT
ncbi:UDP-glucosyltransferase 2-like [Aphomia sociella]